ncbi:MAG: site-specific integrase [Bacteroidales bacterium]|nr:site-specific integrase [Bacteroidales bacterium]
MKEVTLSEIATLWKKDKKRYVKATSYSTYVLLLNKHILPEFGEATSIQESKVQTFALKKLEEGLSQKSVRELVLILKMIVRFGAKLDVWPVPDWTIRYPSEQPPGEITVLSKQDHRKIIEHIKNNFTCRNLGIYICLSAGLRIGEVCSLQWKDLDMTDEVIWVRKTLGRVYLPDENGKHSRLVIGVPKTQNAVREIPMSKDLLRIIRPLIKLMNPEYYLISNSPQPIEPKTYRLYYKSFMTSLGMPVIKFHGLRHSFATRCIESGCDYKTVSVLLGHANIGTTLNLYVHPNLDQKKKVINQVFKGLR